MTIQPDTIVETPSGAVMKVLYILGDVAHCRYLGNPISVSHPISTLRVLGPEQKPLQVAADFAELIRKRNEEALELAIRTASARRRGRQPKAKSLDVLLAEAMSNPAEFNRLLAEYGLIQTPNKEEGGNTDA